MKWPHDLTDLICFWLDEQLNVSHKHSADWSPALSSFSLVEFSLLSCDLWYPPAGVVFILIQGWCSAGQGQSCYVSQDVVEFEKTTNWFKTQLALRKKQSLGNPKGCSTEPMEKGALDPKSSGQESRWRADCSQKNTGQNKMFPVEMGFFLLFIYFFLNYSWTRIDTLLKKYSGFYWIVKFSIKK